MKIFLSGPMGSGKSAVGQVLHARDRLPLYDLDELVATRAGQTIVEIFQASGEERFRALEGEVLRELLSQAGSFVVSLGGGTVVERGLRRALLDHGVLVTLHADLETLVQRVGPGTERPLLATGRGSDLRGRLRAIVEARADAYAESHARIDTSSRTPEQVADRVLEVARRSPIAVPLGTRSYPVLVGAGVRAQAAELIEPHCKARKLVLVSDSNVAPHWLASVAESLEASGLSCSTLELPAGEQHKTIESVTRIWEHALTAGLDRACAMISLGGGVVGDLTGFAASTLVRGVPVGHIATSLLAMSDSAVGGKTGFDTAHGKNLVGSFHQPAFVLCDIEVLSTLPQAERRAGLAEVAKSAWIDSEAAVAMLERDVAALVAGEPAATERAIRMAATMKARVVTADEREGGIRAWLNFGHTLGHAIEAAEGYSGLRHGEAVALGMVAAIGLAERLGRVQASDSARLVQLLRGLGLPTDVQPYLQPRVFAYLDADKKRRGDTITFVLPGKPGDMQLHPISVADLTRHLATL